LAIAGMLALVSIGHTQNGKKTTIEFCRIIARLQALNLDGKWVQFNGLKWGLADNFTKAGLPPEWQQTKSLKFNDSQNVWVYVYVRVGSEASSDAEKMKKTEKIKLVDDPAEIQKIHERGGKIYRIQLQPA
jgi:hypothetical protein